MGDYRPLPTHEFIVVGHRGAAGRAPENTISSFRYAWQSGVRAVELDVQRVDDELVVLHDDTVDRTTDAAGKLCDFSLSALRELNAGNNEAIPLLREVLAAAPDSSVVNVELKGRNTADLVVDEIARWPDLTFVVSSFDHRELAEFDALASLTNSPTAVAPLFHYWRSVLKRAERFRVRGASVNLSNAIATPDHVEQLIDAGWDIWVYTVNDVERAEQLRSWGVRGVFSDIPDALLVLEC